MSKSHNKKRNVGLLYEFLVNTISKALVDGDQKLSSKTLRILKKHFKPGTELYKEFRLINALQKTTVSSESVASNILYETRSAARSHNSKELDRQKSLLIRDINHIINNEDFYDQQVSEYKFLATTQTLLNDWRTPNSDLHRIAMYEDSIVKYLMTSKNEVADSEISENTSGENRMLMKVMTKKINEKYSGSLTTEQKTLLRTYAYASANADLQSIKLKLSELKENLLPAILSYVEEHKDNKFINKKLIDVKSKLIEENLDVVNDETITRFMLYAKLASELTSREISDNV